MASSSGATHSIPDEEKTAFVEYINQTLADEADVAHLLPISTDGEELFQKCGDGVLLCKLINLAKPDTIDERVLNRVKGGKDLSVFKKIENANLAINSAKAIGCRGVFTGAQDVIDGIPHLIMGLVWQIIKMGLVSKIDIKHHPELYRLLEEGEEIAGLLKLAPEKILLRWVNFHLKNADWERRVTNFTSDISDSENYTVLLSQLDQKQCGREALEEDSVERRAEMVLENADKLGCKKFVAAADIVKGNQKLNMAFVANLFNTHPTLEELTQEEIEVAKAAGLDEFLFDSEGSREARAFTLWLNSLGIEPFVNSLFADLQDGLVLLRALDTIQEGIVDWAEEVNGTKKINPNPKRKPRPLNKFKMCENCCYVVELCKKLKLSLVNVCGNDIYDMNQKLVLGLVWQLMRFHIVTILKGLTKGGKEIKDTDLVKWANESVKAAGKTRQIADFKDPQLNSGLFLIDLLQSVKPEAVDESLVTDGASEENALLNAKYAISIARMLGCTIFCLPEDIVEVNPKMILTFVGSVMAVALGQQ